MLALWVHPDVGCRLDVDFDCSVLKLNDQDEAFAHIAL
jgi:hypothetical protein